MFINLTELFSMGECIRILDAEFTDEFLEHIMNDYVAML